MVEPRVESLREVGRLADEGRPHEIVEQVFSLDEVADDPCGAGERRRRDKVVLEVR